MAQLISSTIDTYLKIGLGQNLYADVNWFKKLMPSRSFVIRLWVH